jgi:hypothetical protein
MRIKLIVSLMLAGVAAAANAQPANPQPNGSEAIVVEGIRDREQTIRDFVGALTPAPIGGQLSRFDWAVCPAAVGLGGAQDAAVVERMRKVAQAAGVRTAKPGCKPNALLFVTRDKTALIEGLHRQYPAYFSQMSRSDVHRLAKSKGPAAAWQVEGLLSADGIPVKRDIVTGQYIYEATDVPSRIRPSTRPNFVASILVVEAGALKGLTLTQLADYAAMRTLARTDPKELKTVAAPSILTVLEAPMNSAIPITLTQWDLSFLKALYSSDPNSHATSQRGEMRRLISKELNGKPQRQRKDR